VHRVRWMEDGGSGEVGDNDWTALTQQKSEAESCLRLEDETKSAREKGGKQGKGGKGRERRECKESTGTGRRQRRRVLVAGTVCAMLAKLSQQDPVNATLSQAVE